MQSHAMGIDLGTTEVKVVLIDEEGGVVAAAGAEVPRPQTPQPGWSEQRPEDWWAAVCRAVGTLRERHPALCERVAAVGLAGQMHGAVLLDSDNQVLRPAILWNDSRASAECLAIEREVPGLESVVGSRVMPGLTAPKLRWLATHEPEVLARLDCVLLPKDYIGLRLTGERFTDMSDAAGTCWLDIARRRWHRPALAASGIGPSQLPRLHESSDVAGYLPPHVASRLGLPAGIVVAAGGGDNPVAAVGIGVVEEAQAFVTLGTSAAIFVARSRPVLSTGLQLHGYCHALPQRWYQMGAILSGASCLRWASRLTGLDERELSERALQAFPDHHAEPSDAPLFLPYLAGERTPHNDPDARGTLVGLTHASGPGQLAYAVMEGVGFGLLDGLDAIRQSGEGPREVVLVGGGSRSAYWPQLLANILAIDVVLVQRGDLGAAIGAARLGFLATGRPFESVVRPAAVTARYQPQAESVPFLARRHHLFKAAYRDNARLFKAIACPSQRDHRDLNAEERV